MLSVHVAFIRFPRRGALLSDVVFGRPRPSPTGVPCGPFPQRLGCEESLPSETTGAVPGAEDQTTTRRRFHPVDDGHPEPNVSVTRCAGECEGGHATPLAPQGISALLALEVPANGTTSFVRRPAVSDPENGRRNRHLGRGTHCQRTDDETRDPGLAPHRPKIPEQRRSSARARPETALADVRSQ